MFVSEEAGRGRDRRMYECLAYLAHFYDLKEFDQTVADLPVACLDALQSTSGAGVEVTRARTGVLHGTAQSVALQSNRCKAF